MSFVLTKGPDDEDATEFVYVACAYACVACENPALRVAGSILLSQVFIIRLSVRLKD